MKHAIWDWVEAMNELKYTQNPRFSHPESGRIWLFPHFSQVSAVPNS